MSTQTAMVEGYDKPLPLYQRHAARTAATRTLAEVRRIGIVAQMVDPADPGEIVKVNIADRTPVRAIGFALDNYTEPFLHFDFLRYLRNSVFVTVVATLITLLINSMAAFALSKYQFRGRDGGDAADRRDADGAALGDPGAALLGDQRAWACSTRSGA